MEQRLEKLVEEARFRFSRSQGAGGQHVNKVETRVELLLNIPDSYVLSEEEKARLLDKLSGRINEEGVLIVGSQAERSQYLNKEKAIRKFKDLIAKGIRKPKKRKKVKPLTANKEKRLKRKRQQSEKKTLRGKVDLPAPKS